MAAAVPGALNSIKSAITNPLDFSYLTRYTTLSEIDPLLWRYRPLCSNEAHCPAFCY